MQPFSSTPVAPSGPPLPPPSLPPAAVVLQATPAPSSVRGLQAVHWYVWGLLAYFTVVVAIGLAWDGAWHATHVFDSFFSPPHVFVYTNVAIMAALVAILTFMPRLRAWLGPGWRVWPLRVAVPGPLFLTGGGLTLLGLAGCLDLLWHTSFGLDEITWSTPHAMIGWGLLLTVLGLISCRLALRRYLPLQWYSSLLLGLLALAFSATPFMGPFYTHALPAAVRAIASIPTLAAQSPARHTFRIYLQWNLTRTNPVFIPLSALWAGAVLAFARRLDRRAWVFLVLFASYSVVVLASSRREALQLDALLGTHLASRPAAWLPLPVLAPAAALVLLILAGVPDLIAWPVAGAIFGGCVFLIWGTAPLSVALIMLAAPVALVGYSAGEWAYHTLSRPTNERAWLLVFASAVVPFAVGSIDLFLRTHTP